MLSRKLVGYPNNKALKIDANTKISAILKENPDAIAVIAGINKHFKKLQNPILRKTLAHRVSIKDAAKIGGVDVDTFLRKLQEIGFEIAEKETTPSQTKETNPTSIKDQAPTLTLDVRPDIEAGKDPFKKIMSTIKELKEGDILKVINSFEPIPLINLLRQKGFSAEVDRPEPGMVVTFFRKEEKAETPDINQTPPRHQDDFDQAVHSFGDKIKEIDVRMMQMPEPMVTILSELETLPKNFGLLVHHKKFPKFLMAELATRNYKLIEKKIDDHNMDLIIFKKQ